ncbi:unnamed protein product [Calicophoron daubneyi]|uniref:Uncharacterized protein n=1 Tax=Calicophoron daubneyi TaxID=300641 RepID=A0AAV2TDU3_CALDB
MENNHEEGLDEDEEEGKHICNRSHEQHEEDDEHGAGIDGPPSVVPGDTSVNIPYLRVACNHAQLLSNVVSAGRIPCRLTCLESILLPSPTTQPVFASTRDPSQIDNPPSSDVGQRS